jgi:hypothetical protein
MKRITVLWPLLGFLALLVAPARAQLYGNDMPAYSHGRVPGMDPLAQQSFDGRRFDSTVEYLQRKAEEDRRRRELQERQRRRSENDIVTTPERLLDSYFSRRSYSTR